MFSFYSLPSSVLNSKKHATLDAAYLFYYATDVVFRKRAPAAPHSGSRGVSPWHEAIAANVPGWQRSELSGLDSAEASDERGVTPWYEESPETKAALKQRLLVLMQDMLVIAKKVRAARACPLTAARLRRC